MSEMQQTLKNDICFNGKGIHTGVKTNMRLLPAKEDTGIVFVRTDLEGKPIIQADISNLLSTNRSTCLKQGIAEIHTVEHILASIIGNGIDNLIIEVDNIEIPILDGSAKEFSEKILESGVRIQDCKRKYFEIKKELKYFDKESGTEIIASPAKSYIIDVSIDYESKILGIQNASLSSIKNFNTEIASSRTFCFLHELEYLLSKKLVKGGDINNAIVVVEKEISEDALLNLKKEFNKNDISVNEQGYLNNLSLRYVNEPARHKLLDVIGDLSLLGIRIKGKITAYKPGHKNNTKFAKYLKKIMKEEINKTAPKIDFTKEPLYNKEKIKSILPHRDPFLFIDEIREIGDDYIVGVKFVKDSEDYFKGHFPQEPVMPGVLQLETMAQTGGVLILNTVEDPQNYLTFFMKIDNAKFKRKVVPGDTIIFRLSLISPIRRGLCHMHGVGFVDGKIVAEADLLAQIAPKK